MTGDSFEFGTIVSYELPQTDGFPGKVRPCVVVSCQDHNRAAPDLVLVPATSNLNQTRIKNSVQLLDWKEAGLNESSLIKPVIFSVEKIIFEQERPIGRLSQRDRGRLKMALAAILGFKIGRK